MLLELADVLGPCDRRDAATADHSPLWFLDAMSRYFAAPILSDSVARIFHVGRSRPTTPEWRCCP